MEASLDGREEYQQIDRCSQTDGQDIERHGLDEFGSRHDAKSKDRGDGYKVAQRLILFGHV